MGRLPKVITEDDIYREDQNDRLAPKEYEDPEKALANTLDQFGYPHIPELARRTGMDADEVVGYFHLIQDPILYDVHQDDNEDYLLPVTYLEGKHYYKLLREAEKMNEKYPGRFEANINLLQKYKPKAPVLTVDDIYIGSRCISNYEYGVFIKDLFHLVFEPKVSYKRDTRRYSVEYRDEPGRELNNYRYGSPYKAAQTILLNLMNGDDNIVKTCTYNSNTRKIIYVKDDDQTIIVLEKEKVIIRAFRSFLTELLNDPERADRVYERYTRLIGGFLPSVEERKGDWLTFPGLSRKPYPWQRAGVEDGLTHKALLFVWSTGSGKTLVLTALANELKRMGICSKILFVLPNGSITDFVKEACACYPDNKYLVIDNKQFSANKNKYLDEIRKGDYDAVMMPESSYNLIDMSKQYYIKQKEETIRQTKAAYASAKSSSDKKALKNRITFLKKELVKLKEKPEAITDCFESLGVDALFCDECQMFRRLPMKSGHSNVVGVSSAGSDKCLRHQEKTHYTLYHYEKGRAVFATATPLENSIAEQYVYQRYLQEEDLTYLSLRSIKRWFSEFTEPVQYYGVAANGKDFKLKTKLRFHNLPELNRMVRAFTNFYLIRNGELSLPRCQGFTDVVVPATDEEIAFYEDLAGKLDDLSQGLIKRKDFNQLTAVVLARMAALDIRLADSEANPSKGTTKIEACAEKIKEMYKKYPDKSQVVFCDTGVPKEGFNLYDSLKTLLIETGLFRESEVRFIHEAKTPAARRKILEDFNQARIKVLIGSTQKVGVGVNIQRNLIAAHFLDVPWTPAKLQQKIGRIIRAGNTCEEVYLFRYIKQRSFDAFSWETIESKLNFISQYNSYQFGENCREEDDITALTEITCAEAKALALDDNNIKKHTELKNEISRVKAAYRARAKQLRDLKEKTEYLPGQIEKHERYVEIISEDMNHYKEVRCEVSMADREELGGKVLESIKDNSHREFEYQSFQIEVPVRNKKMDTPYILLYGTAGGRYHINVKSNTPRGVCQMLDHFLGKHLKEMKERHESLSEKKLNELIMASKEIMKGNEYSDPLNELVEKLRQFEEELGIAL